MEHQATLAKLLSTKDKIDVPKEFLNEPDILIPRQAR